ncbi:MAG: peptide chain release factor 2 [Chloroflexi bacterium]|nr:MAG: peptide chain release factor 2 [Chloroflexota bacterium]
MFDLPKKGQRLDALQRELADPNIWQDPQRAQRLAQESKGLREEVQVWRKLEARARDIIGLAELAIAEDDGHLRSTLEHELDALDADVGKQEVDLLFANPYAEHPALISIHAGAGGTDSQDWTEILLRMYLRWAERHKMQSEILDESPGEEAGYKSVTVRISGKRAFGWLRAERGVHRLVRLSPFDQAHRRHTSFALVEVIPEIEEAADIEIRPEDLKVDVYRSSGAGGQHVNKTSSAVRMTHLPTGIIVTCQNERSQIKNRDMALKVLRSRLVALREQQRSEQRQELKGAHQSNEWGSQIRSYVLHPYTLVKDHRTGFETGNVQAVLDGDLEAFMEAFLRWDAGREGKAA